MIEKLRTKISADLHDEIGTSLSSIAIFSELIRKDLSGKYSRSSEILKSIETTSRNLIEKLSDIVWAINPDNDSLEDTVNRFEDYAYQILNAKGMHVNINISKFSEQINLALGIRRTLILIMKEAVTNTAKHSEADNVYIDITFEEQQKLLIFKLKDDGKGFNQNENKKGNGLSNMERRTEELNGKLIINSSILDGTTILLKVPVK